MCNFEDKIKPPSALLAERTSNEHSFEAFLYYYSARSKTEHEPQRRRAYERRTFVTHPKIHSLFVDSIRDNSTLLLSLRTI